MSIGIILTIIKPILSYFKEHKREFAMLILVFLCIVVIVSMVIKLKLKNREIDKNISRIEGLEITNEIYVTQIIDYKKQIYELSKLTNIIEKIKYIPVYVLPEENKIIYKDISNAFLETQAGDYSELGSYTNYK